MIVTGAGAGMSTTVSVTPQAGFVAMGTGGYYPAQFDDFSVVQGVPPCSQPMDALNSKI